VENLHIQTEGFAGFLIPAIEKIIKVAFDVPLCCTNAGENLDQVVAELIGSNQVRQEGVPVTSELQQGVTEIVKYYVGLQRPIPILTPCGGRKTICGLSIDVAELVALKMLMCLQRRVQQHYPPGLEIRIRIEDMGALHLFNRDDIATNRRTVNEYANDFSSLVHILGFDLLPIPESTFMDEKQYSALADSFIPLLEAYIVESDEHGLDAYERLPCWKQLAEVGWTGPIPIEQREYYRSRYRVLYPGITPAQATEMLARYFAGSLARYKLNGTCVGDLEGKYIQVTFMCPIPGVPPEMVWRNIYYRTLPTKLARTHIPFWRGKGYLRVQGDTVCPKLASWSEQLKYNPASITLSNQNLAVTLAADYVIMH